MNCFYYGGGFLLDGLHAIPPEAISVSETEHMNLLQAQSEGGIIQSDGAGRPIVVWPEPQPAPDPIEIRLAELADIRWRAEIGGCIWSGWSLLTDDRSQSKYQSELSAVNEGVRKDGDPWKFPHGFEPLLNAQVREMAIAARQHVLTCFAAESIVASQIEAIPADEEALKNAFDFALNAIKGGSAL